MNDERWDWQRVRRTPAFIWVLAFVLWTLLSRIQGQTWDKCVPTGIIFASLLTGVFVYRNRRR